MKFGAFQLQKQIQKKLEEVIASYRLSGEANGELKMEQLKIAAMVQCYLAHSS